ncbi:hypothetical protein D3C78_1626270 [compost metagenome]
MQRREILSQPRQQTRAVGVVIDPQAIGSAKHSVALNLLQQFRRGEGALILQVGLQGILQNIQSHGVTLGRALPAIARACSSSSNSSSKGGK